MRSVSDVLRGLCKPSVASLPEPPAPSRREGPTLALAVSSMAQHTTDEGWQLMLALEANGYTLCGRGCAVDEVDVRKLLDVYRPSVVVMQDKREWDTAPGDFRDPGARFLNAETLYGCGALVLTVLKDSHQRPAYHRNSAEEIGCHGWVTYYHPRIVSHLAPYTRSQHLVRTYHTVDASKVPAFSVRNRLGCIVSGALSSAYPLRVRLARELRNVAVAKHPGYHRNGTATDGFLRMLGCFRVAVCTSSVYGYALRKIVEATACGCRVLTDLPYDDTLPMVDGNLVRLSGDEPTSEVQRVVDSMVRTYDAEKQKYYADAAAAYYDYRSEGRRLANGIQALRNG